MQEFFKFPGCGLSGEVASTNQEVWICSGDRSGKSFLNRSGEVGLSPENVEIHCA